MADQLDIPALISAEAQRQGVDPSVMLNIARQESSLDPSRNSPLGASYGRGLMGLSDGAARDMGVDPTDLMGNIRGGVGYYKHQLDRFSDPMLAAAAYNAGPEKIARAGNRIPEGPGWDKVRSYAMTATGAGAVGDGADIFDMGPSAPSADHQAQPQLGDGADIFADGPAAAQPDQSTAPATIKMVGGKVVFGDTGAPVPDHQVKFITQAYRGGMLDPNGKPGSSSLPYVQRQETDRFQPGEFYISAREGKLAQEPGGPQDQHGLTSGLTAGLGDVANSVFGLIPGHEDSDLWNSNKAQQSIYEASHQGDTAAKVGRFGGQVLGSVPLLAAGEGAATLGADALPGWLGGAGRFLLGSGGDGMAGAAGVATRTASRFARGAAEGAGGAALTKESDDASLADQMTAGAVTGGIVRSGAPGVSRLLGHLNVGGHVSDATSQLARLAVEKYGIPLRTTQVLGVGDRNVAVHDSEMLSRNLTGYLRNNEDQGGAFTRAISRTFGADSDSLTPAVMQAARDHLGQQFEAHAAAYPVTDIPHLQTGLRNVLHNASMVLSDGDFGPIQRQVQNVLSTVQGGQISGASYQALTRKGSALADAMLRGDAVGNYARAIRSALDDALEASSPPGQRDALRNLRLQYKNMMTVEPLVKKADVEGHVSPRLLRGAMINSFRNAAFDGAGDVGELAQIAQTFMKEPPNSGTAARRAHAVKSLGGHAAIPAALLAIQHEPMAVAGAAALGAGTMSLRALNDLYQGAMGRSATMRGRLIGSANPTPALDAIIERLRNYGGHAQVQAGSRALRLPQLMPQVEQQYADQTQ